MAKISIKAALLGAAILSGVAWAEPVLAQKDDVLGKARAAEGQKHWSAAEEFYRQVLEQDPTQGSLWERLSDIIAQQGRPLEAAEALAVAAGLDPGNAGLQARTANAFAAANEPERALAFMNQALAIESDNSFFLSSRAATETWLGRYAEAEADLLRAFDEGLEVTEENLVRLGSLQQWQDKLDASLETLLKVTQLNPDNIEYMVMLARLYSWRGAYTRSIETIEEYLERGGSPLTHAQEKAVVLAWADKPDASLAVSDPQLALHPDDVPLLIGAYSLASVVGIAAIFAPAGLGVREAVLAGFITSIVASPVAASVVDACHTALEDRLQLRVFPCRRRRDEDTILSSLFGFVHGAVRRRNEGLEGLAPGVHLCDTEARRELDLRPAEMDDRLLHLLPETLREFMGVSCVRVRQENGEFLSAYTSGYIGLSACAGNDTGQGPDHFVPHGMTVCVVDVLEAIDIEQDDGQILSVPSGDPEGGFTQIVERAAVVHAGQEVGARKRLGVLLGLLQFVRQRIGTLDEMARDPQRTIGDDHEKYGRDRHQTFRQAVSECEVQRGR
ncbi:MAG: tetratricopeptide repeat protein, partial [Proteobacteria bacterium]|nr:tetratricopeptide repeat protein [Pseudomonadota bacterium]